MIYIVFIIVTACGACLQGITGMGFSMVCLTALSFILPYKELMVCLKFLGLMFGLPIIIKLRSHIQYKVMIIPIIMGIIGSILGYRMFISLSGSQLSTILGILLIVISSFLLIKNKQIDIKPSFKNGSIAGIISGMMAATCNVSGPPLAIYYVNAIKEDKDDYFATITTHFFLLGVFQLGILVFNGDIYTQSLKLCAIGAVPTILGFIAGRLVFKYVKPDFIRKCVYILMLIMGSILFIKNTF